MLKICTVDTPLLFRPRAITAAQTTVPNGSESNYTQANGIKIESMLQASASQGSELYALVRACAVVRFQAKYRPGQPGPTGARHLDTGLERSSTWYLWPDQKRPAHEAPAQQQASVKQHSGGLKGEELPFLPRIVSTRRLLRVDEPKHLWVMRHSVLNTSGFQRCQHSVSHHAAPPVKGGTAHVEVERVRNCLLHTVSTLHHCKLRGQRLKDQLRNALHTVLFQRTTCSPHN